MRPCEERGKDDRLVANLASKYYGGSPSRGPKEKINLDSTRSCQRSRRRSTLCGQGSWVAPATYQPQRFRAVEANSVERIGSAPRLAVHRESAPERSQNDVGAAPRSTSKTRERIQVPAGAAAIGLAGCERSRKGRVERDESAVAVTSLYQLEGSAKGLLREEARGSERWEAERRQRERMEAGTFPGSGEQ